MNSHKSDRRTIVITGASAGVGRATARAFADRGARIGLIARGVEGLEATRRDVERRGGTALVLPCDVADADAIDQAAERVERELGPIDVWINGAMVSVFSPIIEMTAADYKRVTEVCYLGYVHGTLSALRRMRPRNRGKIVQVGSALAYRGIPLQSAYCGAKHAIEGFTDSLRCELLRDESDISVTSVHLSAMNTPQFDWVKSRLPRKGQPVPPIYQPETAAEAIVWASENDRRELLVGYPTYEAIIGNKLFPSLGDWYLARTGFDSQMRDEPQDPDSPNNLYEPLPGDWGARGSFGDVAKPRRMLLQFAKHRNAILGGLAVAGLVAAGVALARNGSTRA